MKCALDWDDIEASQNQGPPLSLQKRFHIDKSYFAGDEIRVIYDSGSDTSPLGWNSVNLYHGFNGFKI